MSAEKTASLDLVFSTEDPYELLRIEVRTPEHGTLTSLRGMKPDNGFPWTAGVQALCLLFIQYVLDFKKGGTKQHTFTFSGSKPSPASSVVEIVRKESPSTWVVSMFGKGGANWKTELHRIVNVHSSRSIQGVPASVKLLPLRLPPQFVKVVLNPDIEITTTKHLTEIYGSIKRQWWERGKTRGLKVPDNPFWKNPKAAKKQRSKSRPRQRAKPPGSRPKPHSSSLKRKYPQFEELEQRRIDLAVIRPLVRAQSPYVDKAVVKTVHIFRLKAYLWASIPTWSDPLPEDEMNSWLDLEAGASLAGRLSKETWQEFVRLYKNDSLIVHDVGIPSRECALARWAKFKLAFALRENGFAAERLFVGQGPEAIDAWKTHCMHFFSRDVTARIFEKWAAGLHEDIPGNNINLPETPFGVVVERVSDLPGYYRKAVLDSLVKFYRADNSKMLKYAESIGHVAKKDIRRFDELLRRMEEQDFDQEDPETYTKILPDLDPGEDRVFQHNFRGKRVEDNPDGHS